VLKLGFVAAGMQLLSCAGDGLVKVWNVKDEECALTLDAHDDKIWSFATARDEGWFVSAAADGTMHVWEDNTQQRLEVEREQKQDEVRMEQQFANLLTTRDWRNAIRLALQMDQPRRLLNLFTLVANSRPDTTGGLIEDALGGSSGGDAGSITGLASVDAVLASLSGSQLIQLLNYVRDWNTSTRTSPIAQTLLHAILSTHSAASLLALFDKQAKTQRAAFAQRAEDEELGIAKPRTDKDKAQERRKNKQLTLDLAALVDALSAYSERHFQRADRTRIEAAMLEYSITAMDSLLGPQDDDERQDAAFEDQIHLDLELGEHSDVDMSE
jgi:U3 small nucleolar RNA-associated protein 13